MVGGKWWGCGGMGWDLPLFVVVVVVAAVGVLVLRVVFVVVVNGDEEERVWEQGVGTNKH